MSENDLIPLKYSKILYFSHFQVFVKYQKAIIIKK